MSEKDKTIEDLKGERVYAYRRVADSMDMITDLHWKLEKVNKEKEEWRDVFYYEEAKADQYAGFFDSIVIEMRKGANLKELTSMIEGFVSEVDDYELPEDDA